MNETLAGLMREEATSIISIVVAAGLLIYLINRVLKRSFRRLEDRLTWDDSHERTWKALRQTIQLLVVLGIVLGTLIVIINVLGYTLQDVLGPEGFTAARKGFKIFAILAAAFIIVRFARVWIYQGFERVRGEADLTDSTKKRIDTLGTVATNASTILIGVVVALMLISEFGIDIKAILVGAGVFGVALGFGAQNIVRDFLGGFFIILENQYSVGDVVSIGGSAGLVQAINLRTTVLRDLEGKVHVIPNGEIKIVTNLTKEWAACVLTIGVAYKEDVDHVIEVLKRVGDEFYDDEEFRPMLLEKLDVLGVEGFGDSAVMIKVLFKTKPIKQWTVGREFRRRIKKAFDAEGIEIPFPHRTVYIGQGNQGILPIEKEGK